MPVSTSPTWSDTLSTTPKKGFLTLPDSSEANISIIGGGLAGMLSAYLLLQDGHDVTILEAEPIIGAGTTMYTTAFLTKSIDTDIKDMIAMFGAKKTKTVIESHQAAIEMIAEIIKKEKIDCDFSWVSNITYANEPDGFSYLEDEQKQFEKLGVSSVLKRASRAGFKNSGGLELKRQGKFHSIKFLNAITERVVAMGGKIYTNAKVSVLKETDSGVLVATEDKKRVLAQQVIVTTYQPIKSLKTFAKKGQYQSYVFEVAIPKGLIAEGLYEDDMNPYHYFRIDSGDIDSDTDRMIIGGEDHRIEIKMDPERNFAALEDYIKTLLQGANYTLRRKWYGLILEPTDGLPLIGRSTDRQLVATGFSGNGMTYSMLTAKIFSDIFAKRKNPWIAVYDPTRTPTLKQLAYKGYDYGQELIEGAGKNLFHSKKPVKKK